MNHTWSGKLQYMVSVRATGKTIFCYLNLSYLGSKMWEILRVEIKQIEFLIEFKAWTIQQIDL